MPPGAQYIRGQAGFFSKGKKYARIDGLTEVRAVLQRLPEAFREVAADSIDVGSRIILTEAAAHVPFRSRKLKRSLGRNVREDGLQAAVGTDVIYGRFVELGTKDKPAHPFLRPAFRRGARYVRGRMKSWAEEAGQKVKFRTRRPKAAKK